MGVPIQVEHGEPCLPGGWDGFGSKVEATDAFGGVLDWGYPKVDGSVHGKSHLEMDDDWGYPHLWKPQFVEPSPPDLVTR